MGTKDQQTLHLQCNSSKEVRLHCSGLQSFYKPANNCLTFLQKSSWHYSQEEIKPMFNSLVKSY